MLLADDRLSAGRVPAELFSRDDVRRVLHNKFIVIIGDSGTVPVVQIKSINYLSTI